jgi:DNA polymerase
MKPTYRISLDVPDDLDGFRHAARGLLAGNIAPADVSWETSGERALFGHEPPSSDTPLMLPAAFKPLAESVICHHDAERFALLYTAIWRIAHGERALLADAADPLVHRLRRMEKAVNRDLHKMTAFVRFRRVEVDGDG